MVVSNALAESRETKKNVSQNYLAQRKIYMGEMKVAKIAIGPNERLATISKEHHIRKQKGQYRVYLVEDKMRNALLMEQKIADLTAAVNN